MQPIFELPEKWLKLEGACFELRELVMLLLTKAPERICLPDASELQLQ